MITLLTIVPVVAKSQEAAEPAADRGFSLIFHSQGVGAFAVEPDTNNPDDIANVDYYNYFWANGRGNRVTGTTPDQQTIDEPLGLGSVLSQSRQASLGGNSARAEMSVAIYDSGRALRAEGSVLGETDGSGAGAYLQFMLGVAVTEPSRVRITDCDLFEQDVISTQVAFSNVDGTCSFRVSGVSGPNQAFADIPIPRAARESQWLIFEIDRNTGQTGGAARVAGRFSIALVAESVCPIVVRATERQTLFGMIFVPLLDRLPAADIYDDSPGVRGAREREVEIGRSEFGDPEARENAERIAENLANAVEPAILVEFEGGVGTSGVHTVIISTPGGFIRRMDFDFDAPSDGEAFDAVDAFLREAADVVGQLWADCNTAI